MLALGRPNWTKAIDAPVATYKQQVEKAFSGIKDILNEISAVSGPSQLFEGAMGTAGRKSGERCILQSLGRKFKVTFNNMVCIGMY